MISEKQFNKEIQLIIANAIREDVGEGDHSSLACIPSNAIGKAKLLVKDQGIIAGVEFAKKVFNYVDESLKMEILMDDGSSVKFGDIVFYVEGPSQSILKAERLVLNAMQRMSAIATITHNYVKLLEGTKAKILDTRKTTPGIRALEKWAVKIGGGENHRFALYDMIMLKDNHIASTGSITKAIEKARSVASVWYNIEVECKSFQEAEEAIIAGADIIMLDNFTPALAKETAEKLKKKYSNAVIELSGGINKNNIIEYFSDYIDIISMGNLTTNYSPVDFSLKIK